MNTSPTTTAPITPDAVIDALLGSDKIRTGFHMAPRIETAANYGHHVIAIELERDLSQSRPHRA